MLIGSSTWTSASDTPSRQSCLRSAVRVPCTASGRTGAWASMASRNAPSLNSASSPLAERVPSGNTIIETWASSRARHCASAAITLSRSPRTSGMSPAIRISQPTAGILKNCALASHFISHGRWEMSRMSTKLSWLATTT